MMKKNVIAIIMKDSKILLQLRDSKKNIIFPGKWGFFGGALNVNESHFKAIKRELFEELNIKNFKSLKFVNKYFSAKYKSFFYIYILKLNEKIILKEGYDCDVFSLNKMFHGKKSKKDGIFYQIAENNLMKNIMLLAKKFI
jgi:8-oxo-dGTP pyrophosphatase MutT (NUDIX family)